MPLIAAVALLSSIIVQEPAAPLSVMSFNIRYGTANDGDNHWKLRKPATISALQKRRPELIGMQEVLDFQIGELLAGLSGYQSVGVGRDDGRSRGEFSAILFDASRLKVLRSDTFWLSDTPGIVASKGWGNSVVRICTWAFFKDLKTGRYFYLYNLHLDHESQPSREKSVALLLQRIAERGTADPVLISGDFNAGEDNPAIRALKEAGWRDSFRVLHPDAQEVGTFNGFKDAFGKDKIDYLFVDTKTKVLSAEIVKDKVDGRWISDHAPVVATVELP